VQLLILTPLFRQVCFKSLNLCGSILDFLLGKFELSPQVDAISCRLVKPVLSTIQLLCKISERRSMFLLHVIDLISVALLHLLALLARCCLNLVELASECFLHLLYFAFVKLDFFLQRLLDVLDGLHIAGALRVEMLDLQGEFVNDTPCDEVLAGEPGLGFRVSSLSKEDRQVEEVPKFV
jgi:hypothetical protein